MTSRKAVLLAPLLAALAPAPALAHLDPVEHGSFLAGFTHPLFGADHILAMVAVGLWASMIAGRTGSRAALWLVPGAFVATMALGFLAALGDLPLPFVEPVILASVVALGLLVALAVPVPASVGMAVVGFFAFFHGHAHGGEMGSAGMAGYGAGFAVATALLHAAGIALGLGLARLAGAAGAPAAARWAGALTALGGVWLAVGG